MAILTFALTKDEFLSGKKTVTRRDWSERHFQMWVRMWDTNRYIHDAYDNNPRIGGSKIGEFRLTARPYREQLKNMPPMDLAAEGGMCPSLHDFYKLIGKSPEDTVTVIRFERI